MNDAQCGSLAGRVEKYIYGVEKVLGELESSGYMRDYTELLDAAKRYLEDAKYYLGKKDCATALVNVSYAEGLIDSLKYTGAIEPKWPASRERPRKVVVAGTFDIIHPGHLELFRYASTLGDLYVIVSRDANAEKIKGRPPVLDEKTRLEIVSSIKYVKRAVLGDLIDIFKPLEEIRPDIVVLGPDQLVSEEQVEREVETRTGHRPQVIRFPAKKRHGWISSSSDIITKICKQLCPTS